MKPILAKGSAALCQLLGLEIPKIPRFPCTKKTNPMQNTRVVAVEKSGCAYVFDSPEAMIQRPDDKVTHSGKEVDAEWIEEKLSSGPIEWLKVDGMMFKTVRRAWKIESWD